MLYFKWEISIYSILVYRWKYFQLKRKICVTFAFIINLFNGKPMCNNTGISLEIFPIYSHDCTIFGFQWKLLLGIPKTATSKLQLQKLHSFESNTKIVGNFTENFLRFYGFLFWKFKLQKLYGISIKLKLFHKMNKNLCGYTQKINF